MLLCVVDDSKLDALAGTLAVFALMLALTVSFHWLLIPVYTCRQIITPFAWLNMGALETFAASWLCSIASGGPFQATFAQSRRSEVALG